MLRTYAKLRVAHVADKNGREMLTGTSEATFLQSVSLMSRRGYPGSP